VKKQPTDKQRAFIEHYLKNAANATKAAASAGYAHPRQAGSRLLSNVYIRGAIDERLTELAMSANEVIYRLSLQAKGEMPTSTVVTPDGERSTYDTVRALEIMGRHYGLFTDRVEVDWRAAAEAADIPPSELFEHLVHGYMAEILERRQDDTS